MKDFWNQRYGQNEYAYGTEPNAFFQATLAGVPVGRLLLPGEGEGRNAVYAARLGWQVDAFDFSEAGRAKALKLAAARGVTIRYTVATYDEAEILAGGYDAVALIFAHIHEAKRRAVHQRLSTALRPGGLLMLEAYTKDQLRHGTGGPTALDLLYDPADLGEDFGDLDVKKLEPIEIEVHEGPYHHGLASVVRMIASARP